jgi:hypothetical protein
MMKPDEKTCAYFVKEVKVPTEPLLPRSEEGRRMKTS